MSQNKRSTPSKYAYERTDAPRKRSSPLLPVLGLIFFIVFAVVGWLASDAILNVVADVLPGIGLSSIPQTTGKIIATVVVVIVGLLIFGLLAAIFSPKDTQTVKEANLAKEKEAMQARARAARAKQRSKGR